jgi:hypothetical protein
MPDTRTATECSLIDDELPHRLQKRVGLIPEGGLGVGRRAIIMAALTWLPLVVWAVITGRAWPGDAPERLMQHFGVQVRCLVAIPLFILGEATAHGIATKLLRGLLDGGFVTEADLPRLREIIAHVTRLRRAWLPWVVIAGLGIALGIAGSNTGAAHEVIWAHQETPVQPVLGFGGWWFRYVSRPIFFILALGWFWRLALWCIILKRIMRLDLALVPTHPDQLMGLGYLASTPKAFQPFLLAISSVVAARLAHNVLYHGVDIKSLAAPIGVFIVVIMVLMLLPLFLCAPRLIQAKRGAIASYSALVANHGRLVRERWILGKEPEDMRLLEANELGPVVDINAIFDAVKHTRIVPISRSTLLAILLPLAVPMILLTAIQVPIKDILSVLVKTLL